MRSVARAFLTGAAAAGVTKLSTEIIEVLDLGAAHGTEALLTALERAVEFSRWRAGDIRSILATRGGAPTPRPAAQAFDDAVVLTLPKVPARSREAYKSGADTADGRVVVTASSPPPLAADLSERLTMAAMRQLEPELLVTAKTQRWPPEGFPRTLVEAEIAARDESNVKARLKAAGF